MVHATKSTQDYSHKGKVKITLIILLRVFEYRSDGRDAIYDGM